MRLILASSSPRRRDLLAQLGIHPTVRAADVDESVLEGETPEAYVERVARSKCEKILESADPETIVLAADTTVVLDGRILAKPADRNDALAMLTSLAGRTHNVLTAVALGLSADGESGRGSVIESDIESTEVLFAPVDRALIEWYVDTGEPLDKAGAYGMQGGGSLLVESIVGPADNVVGLPRLRTARLFERVGLHLTDFAESRQTG